MRLAQKRLPSRLPLAFRWTSTNLSMSRRYKITANHQKLFAELMATGRDPISLYCDVLQDENAPLSQRRDAARRLKPAGGRPH